MSSNLTDTRSHNILLILENFAPTSTIVNFPRPYNAGCVSVRLFYYLIQKSLYDAKTRFKASHCRESTIARKLECPPFETLAFWICSVVNPHPKAFHISLILLSIKPVGLNTSDRVLPILLSTLIPHRLLPLLRVVVVALEWTCNISGLSNLYDAALLINLYLNPIIETASCEYIRSFIHFNVMYPIAKDSAMITKINT